MFLAGSSCSYPNEENCLSGLECQDAEICKIPGLNICNNKIIGQLLFLAGGSCIEEPNQSECATDLVCELDTGVCKIPGKELPNDFKNELWSKHYF